MSETIEQRSGKYIAYLVVFLGFVAILDQYLSLVETVLMPFILEDYGISAPEFAFWQGIYGVITFGVFFIGWFSDAYGRRKGILVLMLVLGIPSLLIVFTTEGNFHWFMILYSIVILGGLSNLWEIPIAEEAPPKKRGLYGNLAFLIGLIPLYAFLPGPIATTLGWRWAYGIMFFFMLGTCVMWYFMKEPQRWEIAHKERESKVLKIKEALKLLERKDIRYIVMCTIVYSMWTISYILVRSWAGYYFMTIRGYSVSEFSTLYTIAGLLLIFSALLSGFLIEKLGRKITMIIGCTGSVIGFFGLGITGEIVFYLCIYFFMAIIISWIMVYFAEIYPTKIRSTAVGLSSTGVRVTYVVGPLIAFVLLTVYPTMEGFWLWAGVFMIVPLITLFMKPYETKGKVLEEVQEER